MATNPSGQSETSGASSAGGSSQDEIDAPVNGGSETAPTPEPAASTDGEEGPASEVGSDQSEIDSLLDGGKDAGAQEPGQAASGESSDDAGATGGGDEQADIDAILAAADGAASAAEEGPSEGEPAEVAQETRLDSMGKPLDEAAAATQAVIEEEAKAAPTAGAQPSAFELQEMEGPSVRDVGMDRVSMLNDVNLNVKIELGRTRMLVEDVLALGEGSVVELEKLAGDPVDVYVNDRLIARGEVLVLNDSFCVRVNEVLSHDPHRISK